MALPCPFPLCEPGGTLLCYLNLPYHLGTLGTLLLSARRAVAFLQPAQHPPGDPSPSHDLPHLLSK